MKGDTSLDDLANMLSPNLMELMMNGEKLIDRNIVSNTIIDFYTKEKGKTDEFDFERILYLFILDKLFKSGKINFEEGIIILNLLEENYPKYSGKNCQLIFIRKLGVSSSCLVSKPSEIHFESNTNIIESLNISKQIEELKIKIA